MKKIIITILLLPFFLNTQAQGNGEPFKSNFQVTDIYGNDFDLYELLDQGYTVFVDVFATWCAPCWAYHQGGHFKDLYEQYGPNGTGEVFVMAIEDSGWTTIDDFYNSNFGDWTVGVPYPLINQSSVFNVGPYPTFFRICPNRQVAEIPRLSAEELYSLVGECTIKSGVNNGGFVAYQDLMINNCYTDSVTPEVTFQNLGTETITTANLDLSIDGEVIETVGVSAPLEPYETEEIVFSTVNINPGKDVVIEISSINGVEDDGEDNLNTLVQKGIGLLETDTLFLDILTDGGGSEFSWALLSMAAGQVIAESGNIYEDNQLIHEEIPIPESGCYGIFLFDSPGDGLCCKDGIGYVRASDSAGNVFFEESDFGVGATNWIYADLDGTTSVKEIEGLHNFKVFPNPTNNKLNIRFSVEESIDAVLNLTDITGKVVYTQRFNNLTAGNVSFELLLNDFPSGLYHLNLISGERVNTKKVVKF